jgi:hypothetical protein
MIDLLVVKGRGGIFAERAGEGYPLTVDCRKQAGGWTLAPLLNWRDNCPPAEVLGARLKEACHDHICRVDSSPLVCVDGRFDELPIGDARASGGRG